jgi:2-polyprenyl-3-methyl-5-hydroxy-6-metoxy-1,4-benzoquinol methylase
LEEQRYRDGMRRLTMVADGVSRRVRQQYEENPYPRWIKLPRAEKARSLDSYLRHQFPFASFRPIPKGGAIDILIAGCGTGQESIETAQQFPEAQVLAVDLSLSSLSYAKRKTNERGLKNVEYAQADITQLGSLGRMFDIIVSVGVLHHLADPMAGLRELVALLRPGGLMLLGLYSESARQAVVAARRFIAERGYDSTAADIRRCRQDLMAPESGGLLKQLTSFRDFYATSECRDLLFHVQEHRLTLPQIKAMLSDLDLDFIGFLLEPQHVHRYKECFPQDIPRTNLDYWNDFEARFPQTFIGSYVFWVQKVSRSP